MFPTCWPQPLTPAKPLKQAIPEPDHRFGGLKNFGVSL
ncbi:hypothetical protein C4K00_5203 [Pseudomonas synxantha]|nr:hypothetical protein C4K02_5473 [Pseudomonas synxantha]AZE75384.1 hypothetical protein C4K00_5203 [Pseudomonas synxantha]AZE81010.1 hypothetical protein C4J99_5273 [Pseudomonas synxantha]